MRGEVRDVRFTASGKQILSMTLDEDFREKYDELRDKPLNIEIKKYRQKRSKNANDYLWTLCTKIAEDQHVTVDEVYRKEIREAGVCVAMSVLTRYYERTASAWGERGIGWFLEKTGEYDNTTFFLAFYGSSIYDSVEMSRLIEHTIQDAKVLGIETATPEELSLLMDSWEKDKNKNKDRSK